MMLEAAVLRTAPAPATAEGRLAQALNWIEVKLWYYTHVWLDLASMQHMTGADGLPAFWKVAHLGNTLIFGFTVWACHVAGQMATCLPWLLAWATLQTFGSHALKGLQLYAQYRIADNHKATGTMSTTADLAAMIRELRKEPSLYRDDERG